jgi:hypothetical protein
MAGGRGASGPTRATAAASPAGARVRPSGRSNGRAARARSAAGGAGGAAGLPQRRGGITGAGPAGRAPTAPPEPASPPCHGATRSSSGAAGGCCGRAVAAAAGGGLRTSRTRPRLPRARRPSLTGLGAESERPLGDGGVAAGQRPRARPGAGPARRTPAAHAAVGWLWRCRDAVAMVG